MGGGWSQEETLFHEGKFADIMELKRAEAVEKAMGKASSKSGGASSDNKASVLSAVEWEALIASCEGKGEAAMHLLRATPLPPQDNVAAHIVRAVLTVDKDARTRLIQIQEKIPDSNPLTHAIDLVVMWLDWVPKVGFKTSPEDSLCATSQLDNITFQSTWTKFTKLAQPKAFPPTLAVVVAYASAQQCLHMSSVTQGGDAEILWAGCDTVQWGLSFVDAHVHFLHEALDSLKQALAVHGIKNAIKAPPPPPAGGRGAGVTWDTIDTVFHGQTHVVSTLRDHYTHKEVLGDTDKPSVFWFFGPSGHGKSELAKLLGNILHKTETAESDGKLLMLSMHNYCTKEATYSLVDPPTGVVGEGTLLSTLMKSPDAVIVLDEFEKTDSEAVSHTWLPVFQSNGVLRSIKDAARCASTTKTTFILTSNTCHNQILQSQQKYLELETEDDREKMRSVWIAKAKTELRARYGDPLINRIDTFVPFVPYTDAEREKFVSTKLAKLTRRALKSSNAVVAWSPSLVRKLVDGVKNFHEQAVPATIEALVSDAARHNVKKDGAVCGVLDALPNVARKDQKFHRTCSFVPVLLSREACLTHWPEFDAQAQTPKSCLKPASPPRTPTEDSAPLLGSRAVAAPVSPKSAAGGGGGGRGGGGGGAKSNDTDSALNLHVAAKVHTDVSHDLQATLDTLKEKLLATEKERDYYKAYAQDLEVLCGLLLGVALVSALFLSVVFSLEVVLAAYLLTGVCVSFLMKDALKLVKAALRGLYRVLGPFWVAVLVGILAVRYQVAGRLACNYA